ncbi:3'(2'),5'-bisphosphate nucleotidase CysQ [Sulfobacillus acidophilus]|uniref:inositol-phosphate phosphatase n=1 Tax=Sulfobacillus acidophilus TaxID=53633 RepID=A0ABS3AWX5_9FIRM|nr:3'(2'),5'-bisphosphate nucleotidase CysQ [Sulfobacillus acidophilus]
MNLKKELSVAKELAKEAGKVILNLQNTTKVSFKANGEGPVTEADLEADKIIYKGLKKVFQDDQIITEESYLTGTVIPKKGRLWLIDPIDGTSDYIRGGSDFACMIGLIIDGIPRLGVIFQPKTNSLWWGLNARGLSNAQFKTQAQKIAAGSEIIDLNIENKELKNQGPIVAVSKSHPTIFIDFVMHELKATKVIKKGSVGLKIALIAEGKADFYLIGTRKIKLWDTCAPAAILLAAGGVIKTVFGENLEFSNEVSHGVHIYASTRSCEAFVKAPLEAAIAQWKKAKKG